MSLQIDYLDRFFFIRSECIKTETKKKDKKKEATSKGEKVASLLF